MNIEETKEKIEALPDSSEWAAYDSTGGIQRLHRVADLKELIADHTRQAQRIAKLKEIVRDWQAWYDGPSSLSEKALEMPFPPVAKTAKALKLNDELVTRTASKAITE